MTKAICRDYMRNKRVNQTKDFILSFCFDRAKIKATQNFVEQIENDPCVYRSQEKTNQKTVFI